MSTWYNPTLRTSDWPIAICKQDPLLTDDGRKCHIKAMQKHEAIVLPQFYVLLVGFEDGVRWELYTYKA